MPTYEYLCADCGRKFEIVQSINDPPLSHCPYCQGNVKRLISGGGGLLFKGSGFYATDYRSKAYKESAKKDKEPKSDET